MITKDPMFKSSMIKTIRLCGNVFYLTGILDTITICNKLNHQKFHWELICN